MKIAVITEFYQDKRNANAYCAHRMVEGIVSSGTAVDVYTVGPTDEITAKFHGVRVYSVKQKQMRNEANIRRGYIIARHMENIKLIPKWPLESPTEAAAMIQLIKENAQNNYYDGMIAVHKTFLSIYVCEKIKEIYPNLKMALYLLDPIANAIDAHLGLRKYLFLMVQKAEIRAFDIADYVIHMQCNKSEYEKGFYRKYHDKFTYLDFPLVSEENIKRKFSCSKISNVVQFIYFGTLSKIYRSPEYMIGVMMMLAQKIRIEVHVYTQGDCSEMFCDMPSKESVFKVHGFLDSNELEKVVKKSDVIINIGNAMSSMLPSKVLEMIMYGKPIISFSKQEKDVCDGYMERYERALILKETEKISSSVEKISLFLEKCRNDDSQITVEALMSKFQENTPEYTGRVIRKLMMER